MPSTLNITMPITRPVLGKTDQAFPRGGWAPIAGAAIDIDFVARKYWWNGAERTEANFTTFTLAGSTFDSKGLTVATGIDVTLSLSGLGTFVPGAMAAAVWQSGTPGTARPFATLDNGANTERAVWQQGTTNALTAVVVNTNVTQATLNAGAAQGATTLNVRHGVAQSYDVNNFLAAGTGVATSTDTAGTLPAGLTTLRIGKGFTAGTEMLGSVSRVVIFTTTKTQAELNALSAQLQAG